MEKSKFCEELKKKGYDAIVDGGVVIVRMPGKPDAIMKEIKAIAAELGYNQSIGVRTVSAVSAASAVSDSTSSAKELSSSVTVNDDSEVSETDTAELDKSETGDAEFLDDGFDTEIESGGLFEQMNLLDMF